jgi:hypothetical protein
MIERPCLAETKQNTKIQPVENHKPSFCYEVETAGYEVETWFGWAES